MLWTYRDGVEWFLKHTRGYEVKVLRVSDWSFSWCIDTSRNFPIRPQFLRLKRSTFWVGDTHPHANWRGICVIPSTP
jgi:hypothetical protein